MQIPVLLILFLTAWTSACASAPTAGTEEGSRDRIVAEQLAEMPTLTAYEAVRRLRPMWLRGRGRGSVRGGNEGPLVYVDRTRAGGVAELRQIRVSDIQEIRFLDAREATMQFGTGHTGGAILVSTRSGGP